MSPSLVYTLERGRENNVIKSIDYFSLHSVIVAENAIYLSSRIFYDNVGVNAKDDEEKKNFFILIKIHQKREKVGCEHNNLNLSTFSARLNRVNIS